MSNATPASRKIIMQINTVTSQKMSGGFGDFYVDN